MEITPKERSVFCVDALEVQRGADEPGKERVRLVGTGLRTRGGTARRGRRDGRAAPPPPPARPGPSVPGDDRSRGGSAPGAGAVPGGPAPVRGASRAAPPLVAVRPVFRGLVSDGGGGFLVSGVLVPGPGVQVGDVYPREDGAPWPVEYLCHTVHLLPDGPYWTVEKLAETEVFWRTTFMIWIFHLRSGHLEW